MKLSQLPFSAPAKTVASVILGVALLACAIGFRHYLEQTMARHMLMQIPMLIGAGISFNRRLAGLQSGRALLRKLGAWDEYGLTGLVGFLLVTAYWMIPRALDNAIATSSVEQAKVLSLVLAGLLLPASLSRANTILQLFFLGNFASMMAIVGMLYQDAPKRLCNFYLVDDQVLAGMGLVTLAIVLPVLWCLCVEPVRAYFTGKSTRQPPVRGG